MIRRADSFTTPRKIASAPSAILGTVVFHSCHKTRTGLRQPIRTGRAASQFAPTMFLTSVLGVPQMVYLGMSQRMMATSSPHRSQRGRARPLVARQTIDRSPPVPQHFPHWGSQASKPFPVQQTIVTTEEQKVWRRHRRRGAKKSNKIHPP